MTGNGGTPRIIPLEEGWNDEIKTRVCLYLPLTFSCSCRLLYFISHMKPNTVARFYILSCIVYTKAIDRLEAMLEGGMRAGQTNMFGPKEYVAIYT
jgi:hypothetical protein